MQRKLLIIIDEMEIGGSQKQILDTARHLHDSSFTVSVVYFRNSSSYVDELRRLGVEVTHIPKRYKLDLMFFLKLCRFLRNHQFDIIHAFSFSGELWGWLANAFTRNSRFVSTIHSVYEWYSPLQWTIKRWVALGSAALVANSQAGADYAALRMGIRRNTIDIVPNGIVLPSPKPVPEQRERDVSRSPRLVFVGRLVNHKNIECLLRAFELAAQERDDVQLDIVGDGPLRKVLEEQAAASGIANRVHFHGERSDVLSFLHAADIFVITSHREGLSNAIMEAMGAGLPVIASNVGGNPELVAHDHSGMLFPANDHEALASMLLELLGDEAKRLRLADNARKAAQRFNDPARMAAEMERIYERALLEQDVYVVRR